MEQFCFIVDFISFDHLFILDNVISFSAFHVIERREYVFVHVPLHIDTLPCETTKDDILAALMQLLPWVCICIYLYICTIMSTCKLISHATPIMCCNLPVYLQVKTAYLPFLISSIRTGKVLCKNE